MKKDKLVTIKKIMGSERIKHVTDEDNNYYFSIYNIISLYSKYESTSRCWQIEKMKLQSEGCFMKNELNYKLKCQNKGEIYLSIKNVFRFVLTFPSKKLEWIRKYASVLLVDKINEIFNPKLNFYKGIHYYRCKGISKDKINEIFSLAINDYFSKKSEINESEKLFSEQQLIEWEIKKSLK